MKPLATTVLKAPGSTPTRAFFFFHGMLGTRSNLRTLARRFCAARPDIAAVLVDLRHHGDSTDVSGPDTLAQCARDLAATAETLDLPVRGAVGHSYGGKVALAWLEANESTTDEVWVLDSCLGTLPSGGPGTTVGPVIECLEQVLAAHPDGFESRETFGQAITSAGLSRGLVDWLAMNLRQTPDGRRVFGVSMANVHALLEDYTSVDAWPIVERTEAEVHLVVAETAETFSPEARVRADALAAARPNVHTHLLLGAGHWVHVDQFEALLALMTAPA